jgi:hypothetical protein
MDCGSAEQFAGIGTPPDAPPAEDVSGGVGGDMDVGTAAVGAAAAAPGDGARVAASRTSSSGTSTGGCERSIILVATTKKYETIVV